jgi:hypothetical protein
MLKPPSIDAFTLIVGRKKAKAEKNCRAALIVNYYSNKDARLRRHCLKQDLQSGHSITKRQELIS